MTEKLRQQILERHGPVVGAIFYDAEISRQTRELAEATRLHDELAAAHAEFERQSASLARNLPPLEAALQTAYEKWQAASHALEARRVCNQAALSPLMARIALLTTQINEPTFSSRVIQWQVPDWYQPTKEIPPMRRG